MNDLEFTDTSKVCREFLTFLSVKFKAILNLIKQICPVMILIFYKILGACGGKRAAKNPQNVSQRSIQFT